MRHVPLQSVSEGRRWPLGGAVAYQSEWGTSKIRLGYCLLQVVLLDSLPLRATSSRGVLKVPRNSGHLLCEGSEEGRGEKRETLRIRIGKTPGQGKVRSRAAEERTVGRRVVRGSARERSRFPAIYLVSPILPENVAPRPLPSPHLSPHPSHDPAAARRPEPPPRRPPIAAHRVAMASFLKAFKYAPFSLPRYRAL